MTHLEQIVAGVPVRHELRGAAFTIGRAEDCDVVLDLAAVSRHHARVYRDQDGWAVEDLGSRNGTLLNGRPLHGRSVLGDADEITIGDATFRFVLREAVAADDLPEVAVTDEGTSDSRILSARDADQLARSPALAAAALHAILEITKDLGSHLELHRLLPRILENLFRVFPKADCALLLLREPGHGELMPAAVRHRREPDGAEVRVSRTLARQVIENRKAVLSSDVLADEQLAGSHSMSELHIRSVMCVPLLGRDGAAFGLLQVHTERVRHRFTEADLEILGAVASAAAVALENARLHEELMARAQIQRDVTLAREIQRGFLPEPPGELDGFRFHACYEPAFSVGGDYFGFLPLPGSRMGIAIGDVSGKGLSAALLMARLSSEIRSAFLTSAGPAEALATLHRNFAETGPADRFVTLLLMVLDARRRVLTIANAGHQPPLLRAAGAAVVELAPEVARLPLNVSPDAGYPYVQAEVALPAAGHVLAFTDGLTDARDRDGNLLGLERVSAVFAHAEGDPVAVAEGVFRVARAHAAGQPRNDDMTLLCFGT